MGGGGGWGVGVGGKSEISTSLEKMGSRLNWLF